MTFFSCPYLFPIFLEVFGRHKFAIIVPLTNEMSNEWIRSRNDLASLAASTHAKDRNGKKVSAQNADHVHVYLPPSVYNSTYTTQSK